MFGSNRALRILLVTNALVLVAGAMLAPIYALFVDKIGGDLFDAGLTGGVFALAAGITTLIAGRFADKIRENELIVVLGYVIMGVGFLLLTKVGSILSLFLVQALIGFAEAVYAPAFDALYSRHLDRRHAGREWGLWEAIHYFAITIGAIVGGFIATKFGFQILFVIMSVLSFISALYIYFLPRKVL